MRAIIAVENWPGSIRYTTLMNKGDQWIAEYQLNRYYASENSAIRLIMSGPIYELERTVDECQVHYHWADITAHGYIEDAKELIHLAFMRDMKNVYLFRDGEWQTHYAERMY